MFTYWLLFRHKFDHRLEGPWPPVALLGSAIGSCLDMYSVKAETWEVFKNSLI